MSSRIYKITNDINNKVYVGKTCLSIDERFKQHCCDARKINEEKRPLYTAMNKYGSEHFSISLIEECEDENASEREQYWIGYYKGYEDGYNATLGGDGTFRFDHEKILSLIKNGKTSSEIASIIGCSEEWVRDIARANNLVIIRKQFGSQKVRKVKQFDKNTKEFIQEFDSIADAARWVYENGYSQTLNGGTRTNICNVCKGIRLSAYKFFWQYSD